MNCHAVYLKSNNKQIRVFAYDCLVQGDWRRAQKLAFELAWSNHDNGYHCTVEIFHMCDVGKQILDTDSSERNTNF